MVSNEGFASGYKVNNENSVNASVENTGASGNSAGSASGVNSAPGVGSRGGAYRHSTNEISASRGPAGRNSTTRGNPNESGPNVGVANMNSANQNGPPLNGGVSPPMNNVAQGIAQGSPQGNAAAAAGGGHASPQHQVASSSSHLAIPPTSNPRNVKNNSSASGMSSSTSGVGPHPQHNEHVANEASNGTANASANTAGSSSSGHANNQTNTRNTPPTDDEEKRKVYQLVFDLCYSDKRESALIELSRKRETYQDIAPVLWNSFGAITTLLQEIVSIYPQLSPPLLTTSSSNRVCNSLALLQCVASHPETKQHFLNAHIPLFLYPFLNAESKNRPFEYLRLTSLGVIGALVKVDNPDVINFLLQTEIIPLCLRIMETGSELSKTVATFIVQKILIDELGLNYICATPVRFYAVSTVLSNMVNALIEHPSSRLLKHIVRCYLRLSENPKALKALRECLPESLRHVHKAFIPCLKEDPYTKKWLLQLLYNINSEDVLHGNNHVGNHIGSHVAGQVGTTPGAGALPMHTREHAGPHTSGHVGGYVAPTHAGAHSGVSGGLPGARQSLHGPGGSKGTYAGVTIPTNMSEGSSAGGVSGGHGSGGHVGGAHPSGGPVSSSSTTSNSLKDKANMGNSSNANVGSKPGTAKAMANASAVPSSAEASVPGNDAPSSNATNNAANGANGENSSNSASGAAGATNNASNSNGTEGQDAQEASSGEGANSAGKAGGNAKTGSSAKAGSNAGSVNNGSNAAS
ncbi:hypothetical protein AK88_01532 [Plasmodium fragile]|uniref:Cell differentiation protein rcd1 n=1 Tax=Plasmodium fragile TaxID=5857 RepID=A0A0D9QPX0_PLAFR|nr:uncharacterized protein AK88_01532 [Plasmodium fragile]KJP88842.1 hypothetical protein AK88_01532 [Plasmodium fragile]